MGFYDLIIELPRFKDNIIKLWVESFKYLNKAISSAGGSSIKNSIVFWYYCIKYQLPMRPCGSDLFI